jgi:hypothetical protein
MIKTGNKLYKYINQALLAEYYYCKAGDASAVERWAAEALML